MRRRIVTLTLAALILVLGTGTAIYQISTHRSSADAGTAVATTPLYGYVLNSSNNVTSLQAVDLSTNRIVGNSLPINGATDIFASPNNVSGASVAYTTNLVNKTSGNNGFPGLSKIGINSASPVLMQESRTNSGTQNIYATSGIAISGNTAYILGETTANLSSIIKVDLTSNTVISNEALPGYVVNQKTQSILVNGNFAYVTTREWDTIHFSEVMKKFDISQNAPRLISVIAGGPTETRNVTGSGGAATTITSISEVGHMVNYNGVGLFDAALGSGNGIFKLDLKTDQLTGPMANYPAHGSFNDILDIRGDTIYVTSRDDNSSILAINLIDNTQKTITGFSNPIAMAIAPDKAPSITFAGMGPAKSVVKGNKINIPIKITNNNPAGSPSSTTFDLVVNPPNNTWDKTKFTYSSNATLPFAGATYRSVKVPLGQSVITSVTLVAPNVISTANKIYIKAEEYPDPFGKLAAVYQPLIDVVDILPTASPSVSPSPTPTCLPPTIGDANNLYPGRYPDPLPTYVVSGGALNYNIGYGNNNYPPSNCTTHYLLSIKAKTGPAWTGGDVVHLDINPGLYFAPGHLIAPSTVSTITSQLEFKLYTSTGVPVAASYTPSVTVIGSSINPGPTATVNPTPSASPTNTSCTVPSSVAVSFSGGGPVSGGGIGYPGTAEIKTQDTCSQSFNLTLKYRNGDLPLGWTSLIFPTTYNPADYNWTDHTKLVVVRVTVPTGTTNFGQNDFTLVPSLNTNYGTGILQ